MGVSTSSTPRAAKKRRARISSAARSSSDERFAVGRQSTMGNGHWVAQTPEGLANTNGVTGMYVRQPLDHARRGEQNHRGSHVEAAHFSAFRQMQRRAAALDGQL